MTRSFLIAFGVLTLSVGEFASCRLASNLHLVSNMRGGSDALPEALAMLADGSMLAQIQQLAASDPTVRARIEKMMTSPAVRSSLVAAGLMAEDDAEPPTVEALLAQLAQPATVAQMREMATDPKFRERLAGMQKQPLSAPAADGSAGLMAKVQAVRERQPIPLDDVAALDIGAPVLAYHQNDGLWYSAIVTCVPYAATVEAGAEAQLVCDVQYADGDMERGVPASRLAGVD
jgi:hypothetical protein